MEFNYAEFASNLPWYVKAFVALGGMSLIWKFLQKRIPALFEALTPVVLKFVDAMMAAALIHPIVRWFIFGNRANVEAMLTAVCDGLEALIDKIEKRMIAHIEAESAKQAALDAAPKAQTPPPAAPPA